MSEQDYEQLTLFPADSPASRSALPGSEEARMMTVTSGRKCLELYRNSSPVGLLARMLLELSTWHSTRCYLIWKTKATPSKRFLFQLAPSMPRTGGKDALLWATPNTMDSLPCRSYEAMMNQATNGGRKNRKRPGNLREQVNPLMVMAYQEASAKANGKLWPTPTARDGKGANSEEHLTREGKRNHTDQLANAVRMWPTPRVGESKWSSPAGAKHGDLAAVVAMHPTPTTGAGMCGGTGNYKQLQKLKESGVITEEERRNMASGSGGQLNPDWVCRMMGFPDGWLDVD